MLHPEEDRAFEVSTGEEAVRERVFENERVWKENGKSKQDDNMHKTGREMNDEMNGKNKSKRNEKDLTTSVIKLYAAHLK